MLEWETISARKSVLALYESASQPVAVVDRSVRVVWANDAALSAFGALRLPDGFSSLLPADDLELLAIKLSRREPVRLLGGTLPLSSTSIFFSPLPEGDFTLALFYPQIQPGTAQSPEGATRVTSSFSGQMRGPLSMIFASLFSLSRMCDVRNMPEMKMPIQNISQNSYLLLRHCVNVTEFTRFEAGINPPALQTIELCSMIGEICEAARLLTADIEIPLNVTLPKSPLIVSIDSEKLQNALLNVLSNACRYTRTGNEIHVSLEHSGANIKITVTDRGAGIPPEVQPMIFEPFFAHMVGTAMPGGGLGLTVANLSIAALGGSIAVQSTEGRGTTVVFSLPRREPESSECSLQSPRVVDYLTDRFSSLYILLSDACIVPRE